MKGLRSDEREDFCILGGVQGRLAAMSLFGRRSRGAEVAPGDVFRKVGTYGGEWVVQAVFDYPDIPRHVRLVERTGARAMTVAASMLQDPDCFTPLPQALAPDV